ncbi:MAG TPA: DUF4351 domain-containing protein [Pirellulales bacterium]
MHDERFKKLLKEFFVEFFWLFFPEWAERFDLGAAVWLEKELMSDALEGESRFVDLVVKLPTLDQAPGPDGQPAESWLALIHIEIEAADTVAPLRRRMFHYYEPLRRRHDLPVLPIGVYLRVGLDGIGWDSYEECFWGQQLVCFRYPYVGLPALDAEKYVRQDNWLGVALAALMRMRKERKMELASEALQRIVHSSENMYRKTLLCECVSAYLPTDESQREEFENMLRNHPDPGVQAMELGLLDYVERRGEERGEKRGEKRGVLKGQRELVRQQLEERFGSLPLEAAAALDTLSRERLKRLGRSLMSAASLEELRLGVNETDS